MLNEETTQGECLPLQAYAPRNTVNPVQSLMITTIDEES
jgi:hypothetical protein